MTLRGSAAPSSDPAAAPQASSSAIPSFAKPPQRCVAQRPRSPRAVAARASSPPIFIKEATTLAATRTRHSPLSSPPQIEVIRGEPHGPRQRHFQPQRRERQGEAGRPLQHCDLWHSRLFDTPLRLQAGHLKGWRRRSQPGSAILCFAVQMLLGVANASV